MERTERKFRELRNGIVYGEFNDSVLSLTFEFIEDNMIRTSHDEMGQVDVSKCVGTILPSYCLPNMSNNVEN